MTDTIDLAYRLESLLRILSLATGRDEPGGKTFAQSGGASILDMAADMAGEIVDDLEMAKQVAL
jgi:hypothetical protein